MSHEHVVPVVNAIASAASALALAIFGQRVTTNNRNAKDRRGARERSTDVPEVDHAPDDGEP